MNAKQKKELEESIDRFLQAATDKFLKGQKENGGDFFRKFTPLELVKMAKEEVIDQWFYLDNLERQLLYLEEVDGVIDEYSETFKKLK